MKIALVTGAAKHTGFWIAKRLIEEGMLVYVNDLSKEEVDQAVGKLGENARPAVCDLSKPEEIRGMFDKILGEEGQIDVLVNNACIHTEGDFFPDLPLDFYHELLSVNLHAPFLCSQLAAKAMLERGSGSIVMISSINAEHATLNRAAYIVSKGGLEALTRAMALELGPNGIRTNAIAPGYIRTSKWSSIDRESLDQRQENIPLGVAATGEDIAAAVAYLCSEDARRVNGVTLFVDGGVAAQQIPGEDQK